MKKIILAALIAVFSFQFSVFSQEYTAREKGMLADNTALLAANETPLIPPAPTSDNVPAVTTDETTFDKILKDLGGITNVAIEPYATYAEKPLPGSSQHWGGGLLAVWNVKEMVGIGMGLDWLGQLSLVSVNVTFQAPFHPWQKIPSWTVSPFVLMGGERAYSGNDQFNGSSGTVYDIGAYTRFGHVLGGEFNFGGTYGKWTIGDFEQIRMHLFLGWMYGF